jgi:hypothetical protein
MYVEEVWDIPKQSTTHVYQKSLLVLPRESSVLLTCTKYQYCHDSQSLPVGHTPPSDVLSAYSSLDRYHLSLFAHTTFRTYNDMYPSS